MLEISEILESYLKGNGYDLSINPNSHNKKLKKVNIKRDGLFSLKDKIKPESADFILINDILDTKFHQIILKEMLISCKVNGFVILQMNSYNKNKFDNLLEESKKLFQEKAALRNQDNKNRLIVFQKVKPYLDEGDSIDKWSFGIITDGKKVEQVKKQIDSIKKLNIPNYEIILCGYFPEKTEKPVKYLHFKYYDKGWITAQKNAILENSKYENIVVMHDRIIINEDFYKGIKNYGNYFEVLTCKITNSEGKRCGDWMTYGSLCPQPPRIGLLEYNDWDTNVWLDGGFYILKKSVWKKVQWDESLFWNQAEDIKLSQNWISTGILPRFNPYSSCLTLSWRHGEFCKYKFNSHKLGRRNYSLIKTFIEDVRYYLRNFRNLMINKKV